MTDSAITKSEQRLALWLERLGCLWLIVLPLLRPLLWSGELTSMDNLVYATLLGAGAATGLMHRALIGSRPRWSWTCLLGAAFLLAAAFGCWRSEMPARAWANWSAWALHLAAPLALMHLMRRRPGLVISGLVAGLFLEVACMAAQFLWERPALAESFAADPHFVEPRLREQYLERIGLWRLEGTFLLANTLAAYLNCVIPILIGCAWSAWRSGSKRWTWTIAAVIGLAALGMSGSKAGILALLASGMITAGVVTSSARWRLLLAAPFIAGLIAALVIPQVRSALAGSAGVRLDYWRAGVELIREQPLLGYGVEGYNVHFTRVKPPAAEETVIAHSEVVQAAVDLGIPCAALMIVWWVAFMRRMQPRRDEAAQAAEGSTGPSVAHIVVACAFLAASFLGLGLWRDHFDTWPGGAIVGIGMLAIAALALLLCRGLPAVPRWSFFAGALACLLHALVDFHLHSPQVVGVLAWIAALGTYDFSREKTAAPLRNAGRVLVACSGVGIVVVVMAAVMLSGMRQELFERARRADTAIGYVRRALAGELDEQQRIEAHERLEFALEENGLGKLGLDDKYATLLLANETVQDLADEAFRFPVDARLAWLAVSTIKHACALDPEKMPAATDLLLEFHRRFPRQMGYVKALADHYHAMAVWNGHNDDQKSMGENYLQAQNWAEDLVRMYPTHLPFREELIDYAKKNGDETTAQKQEAEILRLEPLVHPQNKPKRGR
jgi:hypothetical protein